MKKKSPEYIYGMMYVIQRLLKLDVTKEDTIRVDDITVILDDAAKIIGKSKKQLIKQLRLE